MDLILVRPKRSEKAREEFRVYVKGNFNLKQYLKLGKYSPEGKAEEWCHKDDFEFYKGEKSNEID